MAATLITATAAASTLLAVVGARKVYKSITAERGLVLPSLRALSSQESSNSAYPEDYYPGTKPYQNRAFRASNFGHK